MFYENFKAGWITRGFEDDLEPCAVFVKRFPAGKEITRAKAYVSALGLYEMTLNGGRAGDARFAPGWTAYQRRLQYQTQYKGPSEMCRANVTALTLPRPIYRKAEAAPSKSRLPFFDVS